MTENPKRFHELDIFRGLAALIVVLFHFSYYYPIQKPHERFFDIGATMPEFFFIISGFVIFFSLEKTNKWTSFAKNRFFRVFPTYWFAIIFSTFLLWLFNSVEIPSLKMFWLNITMFPEIFRSDLIIYSGWTLAVEMQFYVFILILFILKYTNKINLIILVFMFLNGLFHYFNANLEHVFIIFRGLFPFLTYAYLFFTGMLFYKIKTDLNYRNNWLTHFNIIICLLFTFIVHDKGGLLNTYIPIEAHFYINLAFFSIFYLFSLDWIKIPNIKPMVFLGEISYSLYLIHEVLGKFVLKGFYFLTTPYYLALVLASGIMILISSLVTFYFERPIIKWSKFK